MLMEPNPETEGRAASRDGRGWWLVLPLVLLVIYVASSAPVEIWCCNHGYGHWESRVLEGSYSDTTEPQMEPPNWVQTLYAPVGFMARWKPLEQPIDAYYRWCGGRMLSPAGPIK
jgi:hypothetical protein